MYDKQTLIDFVYENSATHETYPFNKSTSHEKIVWTVMKHNGSDKITAMIFEREGVLYLSLKLSPDHVDEMIKTRGVDHGYHMNKQHWVTISVNDTDLTEQEILGMLAESDALTK